MLHETRLCRHQIDRHVTVLRVTEICYKGMGSWCVGEDDTVWCLCLVSTTRLPMLRLSTTKANELAKGGLEESNLTHRG